jgi:VIT1/CCC1 family predicted Fe2+/Mn2+ transporter
LYVEDVFLAALIERLGLGGREMTASGHSKDFVLKVVQPSLVGLMDGSVSTLAPLFATAFATGDTRITFLVGLAAAVGAAISMGFSEGLSDDGSLTGRGHPLLRGFITGVATFVGGILHTLPFLLPQASVALYVAFGVVGIELLAISFIRYRFFNMSFLVSALQVILGGALVFASGILIGSA